MEPAHTTAVGTLDDPPPVEEWLTINGAAARVGVSRRTIYTWTQAGKLVTCRTAGGSLRILASSLFRRVGDAEP